MDKDRSAGIGHQIKGSVKEAAGKVTGDHKLEAEGKLEKAGGKVQNAYGSAKDSVRDAARKH
ncbi:CsbD family protein [Acidisoma silvae]|uniref:CsbD family protein n=1 Tax=Acidisoma silvae TaxID=2802396 RepID=A0A964DY99_9PROT|nr:CsbD family protein [Acidisoma silvae]MCB8874739.1 CsbD family protein [Acidisoma silvae]